MYSLTIIIFELFSGINPFPGHIGQIFQAKMSDKKPAIPSDFPSKLKELVIQGWSKDQEERPPIEEFKSALNKMLTSKGTDQSLTLPEINKYPTEEEVDSSEDDSSEDDSSEVDSSEETKEELCTSTIEGNPLIDRAVSGSQPGVRIPLGVREKLTRGYTK